MINPYPLHPFACVHPSRETHAFPPLDCPLSHRTRFLLSNEVTHIGIAFRQWHHRAGICAIVSSSRPVCHLGSGLRCLRGP
ncbi:hypothetical protein CEXT_282731 [Caerostris extrusa]|uniref:Uncharacterized protein n=1 Tax=Caerostris extrusa TaxID=172846 RepID=A0AAV4WDW3_CAEEX|nr:hypothetical protein CEXT_282731 [Caerostris extrusa]